MREERRYERQSSGDGVDHEVRTSYRTPTGLEPKDKR